MRNNKCRKDRVGRREEGMTSSKHLGGPHPVPDQIGNENKRFIKEDKERTGPILASQEDTSHVADKEEKTENKV